MELVLFDVGQSKDSGTHFRGSTSINFAACKPLLLIERDGAVENGFTGDSVSTDEPDCILGCLKGRADGTVRPEAESDRYLPENVSS